MDFRESYERKKDLEAFYLTLISSRFDCLVEMRKGGLEPP